MGEKKNLLYRKIEFSGHTWFVAHSTEPAAPGPNFWSGENVWVDEEGLLHLRLTKNQTTGLWNCAELFTEKQFGLGTYELFVEGSIDKFDRNVVFGIFNYSGTDKHDEIDIEFSKWGRASGANIHYAVWPRNGVNADRWSSEQQVTLDGTHTTQRIIRSADAVNFQSAHGFRNDHQFLAFEAKCSRKDIISSQSMPLYLNLWLFNGKAPTDGKEVEIIIHKFSFTPES
jgi:hypothetical protein